jgi:predicted transposase YbfD/YdcC
MSEENTQHSQTESETQDAKEAKNEFVTELNRLGENLGNLFKSMWESEERKSIERELNTGLDQLSKRVNETVEQLRKEAAVENVKKAAKDALETARVPKILNEVQQGMLDSLKKLNEEIAKRAQPAQEAKPE